MRTLASDPRAANFILEVFAWIGVVVSGDCDEQRPHRFRRIERKNVLIIAQEK